MPSGETTIASVDTATNTWKVWVGSVKETPVDADELKAKLAEKGFEDAIVVTEKKVVVSADAVALSATESSREKRGAKPDKNDRINPADSYEHGRSKSA